MFKVVPLVSSGVGIWMQVFLRPTPNTFWDVTGLKKSVDPFLALPTLTLKYGREKKPSHQPVCHCQNSGPTKTQETR